MVLKALTLTFLLQLSKLTTPWRDNESVLDPFSLFGSVLTLLFFFWTTIFLHVLNGSALFGPKRNSWLEKLETFGKLHLDLYFITTRYKPIYRGSTWNNCRNNWRTFRGSDFLLVLANFVGVKRGEKEWKSRVQTESGAYAKRASRKKLV